MALWALPIIAYKNIGFDGTLDSVTSEASGFPGANAVSNYNLKRLWKPTTTATQNFRFDAGSAVLHEIFCISNHDLGTQTATVEIFHSTTGAWAGEEVSAGSKSFTSDDPAYLEITAATKRYWQIQITSLDAVCFIGYMSLGSTLTMEKYAQAPWNTDAMIQHSRVNRGSGDFIGVDNLWVERNPNAEFVGLSDAWFKADLRPFIQNHYMPGKPFFLIPDKTNDANRIMYLWAGANARDGATYNGIDWNWGMKVTGKRQVNFA